MDKKVCSKCGIEKDISDFYKKASSSDGHRSYCKFCEKGLNAERRYLKNCENEAYKKRKELEKLNEELVKENKKICSICGETKNIEDFYYRKDNNKYRSECKTCFNIVHADKNKSYRDTHKEHYSEYHKEYRKNNRDILIKKQKDYNQSHFSERRQYRLDHLEEIRQYYHTRKENDILYKFIIQTRNCIRESIKRKGYNKKSKTFDIVGCDFETLMKHLNKTFKKNYGYYWNGQEDVHIDHIIPLATAKNEEEVIKLCHYTNLQLLKAQDNLEKHDKLDWKLNNE